MIPSLPSFLGFALAATSLVQAQQLDPNLTGTWTTKSYKVFTGPAFYDPINDKFFEPQLTGQSYSFTSDGWYETALYKAISNSAQPNCPQGIMQWQHGTYTKNASGWLTLKPIAVDGRQLLSSPCDYKNAVFTRYNQTEYIKTYNVGIDNFNKVQRLDLFQFDGAPQNPMWLAYSPPQMLPTQTLNPTTAATGASKATGTSKAKRSLNSDETSEPQLEYNVPKTIVLDRSLDRIWWMVALGTVITSIIYLKSWRI